MHKQYLEAISKQLDMLKKYDRKEYKRQEEYLKRLNKHLGVAIMLTPHMMHPTVEIKGKRFKL